MDQSMSAETSPWPRSTFSTKKVSTSRGPCFTLPGADAADADADAAGAAADAESADADAADVDAEDVDSDSEDAAAAAAEGAVGADAGAKRERCGFHEWRFLQPRAKKLTSLRFVYCPLA